MTTKEALIALGEGKKLTRSAWHNDEYIHIVNGKPHDEKGREYVFSWRLDYELYKEPEKERKTKTITMYRSAYKGSLEEFFVTDWRSDKECLAGLGPIEEKEFEVYDDE